MLFNSYEFLFCFLPATLIGFFVLSRFGLASAAAAWLTLASLFFYGYWSPQYTILLLASIAANYLAGRLILSLRGAGRQSAARIATTVAVSVDLAVLAYFKYADFLIGSVNLALSSQVPLLHVVLPIGVSFFTFTQIAYLIDTCRGEVSETRLIPYALFVTYFPHLIAGPVLHHAEMMPQFARASTFRFVLNNMCTGALMLCIGLFKKVVLADGIQPFVSPVFEADPAHVLGAMEAWGGALAYSLQLYFDFSGYSDMAIGLSKMVNVDLPLNFNSPYKAVNIADFWRRWHMTLSRFLRDYLYIPLGGNRRGLSQANVNLLITMLLGGLWHGASWTFVIWGGIHGLYLVVHRLWRTLRERLRVPARAAGSLPARLGSVLLTFIAVVVAWVFFRAHSFDAAARVLRAMAGLNGFGLLPGNDDYRELIWIVVLLGICWALPNSQSLISRCRVGDATAMPRFERVAWMSLGAMAVWVVLLAAINGSHGSSEFIYFNF